MKRAVWLPNWIGDAVMATPTLRLLRQADPSGELVGIYRGPILETLAGTSLLDKCLADQTHGKKSWREQWQFIRRLQREEFDEILLLTNSFRTAAVTALARIPRRIGLARDGRGWLLTHSLAPTSRTEPNPALDEYLRVARFALGEDQPQAGEPDRRLQLALTRADLLQYEDFATRHCLDEGQYVCLNSGGAFGAAKHWPVESFAELALRIVREINLPVVMLCGPAERDLARDFVTRTQHPRIFSLAEEALGIGLSKAIVKHARAMITTDSGPRHFAAAFDVPVLTLFGPTHIAWSETHYPRAKHLQLSLDCGPCQQRTCPLGHHRCMRDLSVSQVYQAFLTLEQQTELAPQSLAG